MARGRSPVRRGLLARRSKLLLAGLGAWAYGVSQIRRQAIGSFGLLASANVWFFLGLAVLLAGGLLELSRPEPRTWLLGTYLAALIVAIHATVPILYGAPEYAWVYKHIGIAQALGRYGRVTDPSNIYQQWPALFAAVASVSGLARVGPLSFAAWGPLAFELADALLLFGIFRLLGGPPRRFSGGVPVRGPDRLGRPGLPVAAGLRLPALARNRDNPRPLAVGPGAGLHGHAASRAGAGAVPRQLPAPPATPARRASR